MIDVLFINSTDKLQLSHEINGTMILATKLLQAGFRADILRFCQIRNYKKDYQAFIDEIVGNALAREPRCVSFYTLWPYYHIMLRIASEIKRRRPEITVVLGGPQASLTAADTMAAAEYVDFICTGEGENTVVPFFRALLEGHGSFSEIPGLVYREKGEPVINSRDVPLCDLDSLPYWDDRLFLDEYAQDRDILTSDHYYMPIDAGRGCPFSCTYCCTSKFWRRAYRMKSPERIIADMKYWNRKYGIRSFTFSHDAFTVNRRLVAAVCDRILEEGLDFTWKCESRIDCLTEELVLKMKQAGMTYIEFGIETGSQRMQQIVNKKLNLEKAKQMIDFLREQKIQYAAFFIYGFPEETEQDLNQTLELHFDLVDQGALYTSLSICRFNPGTHITQKYFDALAYAPEVTILARDVFGHEAELPIIRQEKRMFPFFYHLHTPVRDDYSYIAILGHLYKHFPLSASLLRQLYRGDNLKFYRDFYEGNREILDGGIDAAVRCAVDTPMTMIRNMLRNANLPRWQQLEGLMEYDYDLLRIAKSKEDIALRKTYDFSIFDLKLKLPVEQYSQGRTEFLLQKKDGKLSQRVLRVE